MIKPYFASDILEQAAGPNGLRGKDPAISGISSGPFVGTELGNEVARFWSEADGTITLVYTGGSIDYLAESYESNPATSTRLPAISFGIGANTIRSVDRADVDFVLTKDASTFPLLDEGRLFSRRRLLFENVADFVLITDRLNLQFGEPWMLIESKLRDLLVDPAARLPLERSSAGDLQVMSPLRETATAGSTLEPPTPNSSDEFVPSSRLVKYVYDALVDIYEEDVRLAQEWGTDADMPGMAPCPDVNEARDLLVTSIRRFLVTLADSLPDSIDGTIELTEKGQFINSIARSILYRVPVNPKDSGDFLKLLYEDLKHVARAGQYGNDAGRLLLRAEELVIVHRDPMRTVEHPSPSREPSSWVPATIKKRKRK